MANSGPLAAAHTIILKLGVLVDEDRKLRGAEPKLGHEGAWLHALCAVFGLYRL